MASETASFAGDVTAATLLHYARLARSGAGLVMVEYTYIHRSGRSEDRQLGISEDRQVEGLAELALTIRSAGAVPGIQLTHAGGKSARDLTGGALESPSGIRVPVRERELEIPDVLDLARIERWKTDFAAGVRRAAEAGFVLIEFHAAHGYGLNQWLSPMTNQRTDGYGGSAEGRNRLLVEIIQAARCAHPERVFSVRMPGQDFLEGGLSPADAVQLGHALESAGADILDVSSGIGGWKRPRNRVGEGYLVAEAERIQAAVSIPVIGVGGIESGEYIDESLRAEKFALAAVGRAILRDPEAWRRSVLRVVETTA